MRNIIFLIFFLSAPKLLSMNCCGGGESSTVAQLQAGVTMSEDDPLIQNGRGCRAECRACCRRECEGLRPMAITLTAVGCIFCAVILPSAICACH